MTVCNMSIEGGARAGLIAPDETTFAYIKGRPKAPKGAAWDMAMRYWQTLYSDDGAEFDREVKLDAVEAAAAGHLGHEPGERHHHQRQGARPGDDRRPRQAPRGRAGARLHGPRRRTRRSRTSPSSASSSAPAPTAASRICAPRRRSSPARRSTRASPPWSCRAPGLVKEQAEAEGLDKIFIAAGFEWREPGCSMCLAMNDDRLKPGERCASTSNRNFEGRQGFKGRTHLVSPAMAAAAAIAGRFVDVREWHVSAAPSARQREAPRAMARGFAHSGAAIAYQACPQPGTPSRAPQAGSRAGVRTNPVAILADLDDLRVVACRTSTSSLS